MIYIKRNPGLIPEKLLEVAERAQQQMEVMLPWERKAFIEKKSHIWRAFKPYLSKMSYGKCWYSESLEPQSFFDVDHFRPKNEAKRSPDVVDGGYPWLAFSWDNFRYSAGRSNRLSTNEESEEVVGKSSWFPLVDEVISDWDSRCEDWETPALLDPTVRADVDLIDFNTEDGRAKPSWCCTGDIKKDRLKLSVEIYGLDLPNLTAARKRVMREILDTYANLAKLCTKDLDLGATERLRVQLRRATMSNAPYARAARAKLYSLPNGAYFCAQPEDEQQLTA